MHGVMAAGGPHTVAVGKEMLGKGGNAVDAAVAAAFVSFIAEIGVVHLGGSGVAHIYDPKNNHSMVYDFFSDTPGLGMPKRGQEDMDFARVTIDFGETTQDFHLGRASVAVPGNIHGLWRMAQDYARLPWSTLLEPAIELAQKGVMLEPFQADTCALLAPLYTNTAEMRDIFYRQGRMIEAGEMLYIPDLAETLTKLAEEGQDLARTGSLAQTFLADQRTKRGLVTQADLINYQVQKLSSIQIAYREFEVLLPPPSSSGGVLTAFSLKLLSAFQVGNLQHNGVEHLQLLYEVMAATTRARPVWEKSSAIMPLSDAIGRFLDDVFVGQYVVEVREALDNRSASTPWPEDPGPSNTSHMSVIDEEGLTVSITTTAGESAGYVVPGTGFIPNNIMGEEDLHPHGFHTRPAGKRISTMMTPAIVLYEGQPRVALGSGGSIRIRSAILQVLSNLLDFKMTLNEAVEEARVHIEDGVLQCEAGYDPQAVDKLQALGYPVNLWSSRSIYFGGAHSVSRTPDGHLVGAGDSRRGGAASII
jgi:gamma-glutamyltranspeptidase/glutathione hydrolase